MMKASGMKSKIVHRSPTTTNKKTISIAKLSRTKKAGIPDRNVERNFAFVQLYGVQLRVFISPQPPARICYFVFDVLICQNRDLTELPLVERREILKGVLKLQSPRVRIAEYFETSAAAMLESTAEQELEGVVAKRKDSRYEAGKRSGAWAK